MLLYLLLYRIKFEPGHSSQTEFYRNDHEMPIYSKVKSGYPIGDLVHILLKSDMATHSVCTVQPLAVSENAAFVINPRRMREDYGSRSVCLSFCHSVILSFCLFRR